MSDTVRLSLMESYVLPVLTYALDAVTLTSSMLREFSVCWNNIFRRIFGMIKWESVKVIKYFCLVGLILSEFITRVNYNL